MQPSRYFRALKIALTTSLAAAVAAGATSLTASAGSAPAAVEPVAADTTTVNLLAPSANILPGRQVWGHMVPHGLADYSQGVPRYGTDYPLDLIPGGYWDAPRTTAGVPRAQQAGLTGMQLLQFDWVNKGSDFVDEWMKQADRTWANTSATDNFSVAPCWLITTPGSAVRMAREYISAAQGHPSAAKVNGKYVIYVYAPRNLTPAQWATERKNLAAAGLNVFLLADLQTESSQNNYTLNTSTIDPWAPNFDAAWLFEDSTNKIWSALQSFLASRGFAYAGGTMPGYNRETSAQGGFVDAGATKQFRQQWEQQLASGAPWANIVTWNDVVERSNIKAGSDWNLTRQDINAFYAASMRRLPFPKPTAQLYATTPDFVRLGTSTRAEGLVLNGSTSTVTVNTRLIDRTGKALTSTVSRSVAPGKTGDASISDATKVTVYPAGRFARAETWTTDSAGRTLQRVVSAPILIYGATDNPTPMMRTHYYSIPAAKALPTTVAFKLNGNPASARTSATVSVANTSVRFSEVLQNTRQASLGFGSATTTSSVPMTPTQIVGGQTVSAAARGFYLARVIDQSERVGYSDPVYVP